MKISGIQADIIFKALHYTASNEGLDISKELEDTFEFLAERNPNETHVENTLEVMEFLDEFIKSSSEYQEYIEEQEE